MNSKNFVVPMLITPANSCLTNKNLEDSNVSIVSYKLSSLLIKPGFELLENLASLQQYVGWTKKIVLDASDLLKNSNDEYVLLCAFSGAKYKYFAEQIINLINNLKPDILLLPNSITNFELDIWSKNIKTAICFMPYTIDVNHAFGVHYLFHGDKNSLKEFLENNHTRSKYVYGDLNQDIIQVLRAHNNLYVESNLAALDGFNGTVYTTQGAINVLDPKLKSNFNLIDESCNCQTCMNKFTLAYLHHLFLNTPLLCQRLLILHNIYNQNHQFL